MSAETRAVIYRRQSADRLNDELGIDRQLEVCCRVAQSRGWNVQQVITDNDISASKHGRPGYAQLKSLMASGQIDVVLILRIDRLLRLNDELEELIQLVESHAVKVVTAEGDIDLTTPQGRLLARILVSVARNEIEVKSARHKLANAQKAQQGLPHASWRPFGYEDDRVTIRWSEATVLREMGRRVIAGHSYAEVAQWANRSSYTTARGNAWYPRTVRQMLQLKRSAGIREYEGVDYPATWPAIFDEEAWRRLQLAIQLRAAGGRGLKISGRKYLLTGLLYCGACGRPLNGTTKRDRADRPLRKTYYCRYPGDRRNHGCGGVQRGAPALEHFVTECFLTRLESPRLEELLTGSREDERVGALLAQRGAAQERLNALLDDYATGLLTRAEMQRVKATAGAELSRLDRELSQLADRRTVVDLPVGETVREAWASAESDTWRRSLMSLLIDRIVVHPTNAKPTYWVGEKWYRFDPSAITICWRV